MDTSTMILVASGIAAFMLLPVGAVRLAAYRSGTDHTPGMRAVALLALGLGGAALLVFAATAAWSLLGGR
jgi:hypothetical protein